MEPISLLLVSLAVAGGLKFSRFDKFLESLFIKTSGQKADGLVQQSDSRAVTERAQAVIHRLRESAEETDALVAEMDSIAKSRAAAVQEIEDKLAQLANEEKATSKRIEALRSVDQETKQAFAAVFNESLEKEGKASAKRDLFFLVVGVVTPFALQGAWNVVSGWL